MGKFKLIILSVLFHSVLVSATPVPQPVTWSVKLDGTGDYTKIQTAIDAAVDGDTIVVYPGTYTGPGNRDIDFKGKKITVQSTFLADSTAVANTIIDCKGDQVNSHFGFLFQSGETNQSVLQGFTIKNGYYDYGSAVTCMDVGNGGASPIITNCVFQQNTSATTGGAILAATSCHPQISNCIFLENTVLDSGGGGGAVAVFDNSSIQITNSLFGGNVANRGGAVYAQDTSTITLTNCTLAYNKVTGYGGGASAYKNSTINMVNTIVWGNTAGINGTDLSAETTSALQTQYSDFPDTPNAVYTVGGSSFNENSNLHLDPLFADADGPDNDIDTWPDNDLHLSPLSPCIDAGNPGMDYTGQKDLDNYPRVIHGLVDMGAYEKPFGSLTVHVVPSTITATISLDGGSSISPPVGLQLPIGEHAIKFDSVTDYSDPTPNPTTVNVVEDPSITDSTQAPVVTEVTGTYTKLQAILAVATTPVNGTVTVDGVLWGVAPQSKLVDVGDHTITYGPVSDYETPDPQTVTVIKDTPQSVLGTYIHDTGTISVDTTPVKGEVFIDGVSKGTAPVANISLETGSHTISYGVVDGYSKPAGLVVNVVKGVNPPLTGAYIPLPPDTGTLTIDTTGTKGMVYVNGQLWGLAPQSAKLALGQYTVSFGDVTGYDKPANQQAVVGKDQTTQITGTYVQQTGTLTVSTTPVLGEVLVNGVSWGTSPQAKQVPVGDYTITFGDVTGYTKPAAQTVAVAKNDQKTVVGTYIPPSTVPSGTLTIGTTPVLGEVFVDGKSWGTAPQSKSLPTGNHTISFGEMLGFVAPTNQNVTIVKDQTANITGTYVQLSPSQYHLTVNIVGQGTVQPTTGDYDMDTQLSLLAAAAEYWQFDHWEGDLTGTDNPGSLKMDGNKTVTAVFVEATPQINNLWDWLRLLCLPFAGFTVAGIFLGGSLLGRKSY